MIQFLYMLICGVIAGILSGLFGIGGGIVLVPMMVLGLKFSQQEASGTSLVALLLPVGIFGVVEYYRAGKITNLNIKLGLLIAIGMFLGTYLGARFAVGLSPVTLRKAFAALLGIMAIRLWVV